MRASLRLHRARPGRPISSPQADEVLSINHAGKYATEPDKRLETERPVLIHKRHVIARRECARPHAWHHRHSKGRLLPPKHLGQCGENRQVLFTSCGIGVRSETPGLSAGPRQTSPCLCAPCAPPNRAPPRHPAPPAQCWSESAAHCLRRANAAVSAWRLPRPWSVTCPASASW